MITKKQSALLLLLTFITVYPHETPKTQQKDLMQRVQDNPKKFAAGGISLVAGSFLGIYYNQLRHMTIEEFSKRILQNDPNASAQDINKKFLLKPLACTLVGSAALLCIGTGLIFLGTVYLDKKNTKTATNQSEQKS